MSRQNLNNAETGLAIRTKINENFSELYAKDFKITSDQDVINLGGTISGGSNFTTNVTTIPLYIDKNKGTLKFNIQFTEDFSSGLGYRELFSFINDKGNKAYFYHGNLKPKADELWNQRQDALLYFRADTNGQYNRLFPQGSTVNVYDSYNINQGTLFAIRYVGATAETDIDLRVTKDDTVLKFHYGDGTVKATFTLASYATISELVDAIEVDAWAADNIEVLFKKGLSFTTDTLSYINATKMIASKVRVVDYTTEATPDTPPVDPSSYPDWETVYDAYPVYVEKNTIGKNVEIIISWNSNVMECYLDGKRFQTVGVWDKFAQDYKTTLTLNSTSLPSTAIIKSVEYTQKFTPPRKLFIPIEAHTLTHSYETATGSSVISLKRLADVAMLFKEKGWQCITTDEVKHYKNNNLELPHNSWCLIVDDYKKDWFTTKASRDMMTSLGIKVSFDVISDSVDFANDKELWKSINEFGWNVHTHCKYHTDTSYMRYEHLKLWFEGAIESFDANYLSNSIWTIPFSVSDTYIWKLAKEMGYDTIFTGVTDEYATLNAIPDINQIISVRLLVDDNVSINNLINTLNLFDVYE